MSIESLRNPNPGATQPVDKEVEQDLFQAVKVILPDFLSVKAHMQGTVSIAEGSVMADIQTVPSDLTIPELGETPLRVFIADTNDNAADLSGATAAKFQIKDTPTDAALLTRSTGAATLTINTTDSTLDMDAITAGEWASLPAGKYLADVIIEIGGKEFRSATFYVEITDRITDAIS